MRLRLFNGFLLLLWFRFWYSYKVKKLLGCCFLLGSRFWSNPFWFWCRLLERKWKFLKFVSSSLVLENKCVILGFWISETETISSLPLKLRVSSMGFDKMFDIFDVSWISVQFCYMRIRIRKQKNWNFDAHSHFLEVANS